VFGRRKPPEILREAARMEEKFDELEREAQRLAGELDAKTRRREGYPLVGPRDIGGAAGRDRAQNGRRGLQPTRRQYRRKRNHAVAFFVVAVFVLIWLLERMWGSWR